MRKCWGPREIYIAIMAISVARPFDFSASGFDSAELVIRKT